MTSLAADHAACAGLLRQSGSSFALPIRLLPEAKRRGTTALYAFCRLADDLVDDAPDGASARRGLDAFSAQLEAALAGERSSEPVLRALVDTVRRFAVPAEHLRDVIAGVRMDLDRASYGTFVDLEEYCRRVASAVGLAAIHIWGFRSPAALEAGHQCGLAFQLTNILRDIPEDLGRGRIYLPRARPRGLRLHRGRSAGWPHRSRVWQAGRSAGRSHRRLLRPRCGPRRPALDRRTHGVSCYVRRLPVAVRRGPSGRHGDLHGAGAAGPSAGVGIRRRHALPRTAAGAGVWS